MTWPASDVVTTDMDAGTDSPATARTAILDNATKLNQVRNHVTAFMQALLARATAALARTDLGSTTVGDALFVTASATAARTTLGASATGDALFIAASAAAARATLGVASGRRVQGLVGLNNTATPLTKYDLAADAVTYQDSAGAAITLYNTGTLTVDFAVAGPAANGRDQAGAFSASQWVHIYHIYNGSTQALVASTAAPTTGPVLPSGYTKWAYATTVRWNASSNIVRQRTRGCTVWYETDEAGVLLSAGAATSYTAVNCAAWVPPNALLLTVGAVLSLNHTVAGVQFSAFARPNGGFATGNGNVLAVLTSQVASQLISASGRATMAVAANQQVDYKLSAAPDNGGGLYLDLHSYTVANGDA